MKESAELSALREPDDRMDVVRHHDESHATGRMLGELLVQDAEHDTLRMIVIEQATTTIA
jgi:hypothetical protein